MRNSGQPARVMASVEAQFAPCSGQHNFGDGLTGLQHARAHLAAMSPERRAQLEKEWET